jgi:hypothetical protein
MNATTTYSSSIITTPTVKFTPSTLKVEPVHGEQRRHLRPAHGGATEYSSVSATKMFRVPSVTMNGGSLSG